MVQQDGDFRARLSSAVTLRPFTGSGNVLSVVSPNATRPSEASRVPGDHFVCTFTLFFCTVLSTAEMGVFSAQNK